jgi:hypothetical protein
MELPKELHFFCPEADMKLLLPIILLFSAATALAEEDLIAAFERTECKIDKKTKEEVCTLDGKKLPTELQKKQAQQSAAQDPELDIVTK